MKKKIYPSPRKRNMTYDVVVATSSTPKKLRRLPHVFASVLELPFHSDTDVSVQETSDYFRFTVAMPTSVTQPITDDHVAVRAHMIEIYPGVTKTVIRKTEGGDFSTANKVVLDDLDMWRFRLPASTRPELASATCTGKELVVTVPKDHAHRLDHRNKQEEQEDEVVGEENGRLIFVQ